MGRAKKGQANKSLLVQDKKKELQKYWDTFQSQCDEYESRLNSICNEACAKLRKSYADKLKALPENIRNMTLTEYMAYMETQKQEQAPQEILETIVVRTQYEKTKLESEKKKTLKKNRLERKRSTSVSICSGVKLNPAFSRSSRIMSESNISDSLCTPLSKRSVAPSYIPSYMVTPKFDPKRPVAKFCLRKPKPGEPIMSLSGSPLCNYADQISEEKPGVAVSLGGGKVFTITADTEVAKLESDFMKKLDDETRSTLAHVKEKLDKIFNV